MKFDGLPHPAILSNGLKSPVPGVNGLDDNLKEEEGKGAAYLFSCCFLNTFLVLVILEKSLNMNPKDLHRNVLALTPDISTFCFSDTEISLGETIVFLAFLCSQGSLGVSDMFY